MGIGFFVVEDMGVLGLGFGQLWFRMNGDSRFKRILIVAFKFG